MNDDLVKITFLGDVMCDGLMLETFVQNGKYDFSGAFAPMRDYLIKSDFVCANLETPISISNQNLTNKLWSFNSPVEFADAIKKCGIDFVSTANNHCLDRNIEGLASTVASLDKVGLKHTGVFVSKLRKASPYIEDIGGVKFGFLSYTYGTNAFSNHCYLSRDQEWMVNLFQNQELSFPLSRYCYTNSHSIITTLYNIARKIFFSRNLGRMVYERKEFSIKKRRQVKRDIKGLKRAGVDYIIMYMHAGGQYNLKESKDTINLAHFLKKYGVDIVIGTHEHVVHGSEVSADSVITYSLGNFLGTYGSLTKPFDKMSEYSIALNVYFNTESGKMEKKSFSILKTTISDGACSLKTSPAVLLYQNEKDITKRKKLWGDIQMIANKFAHISISDIQEEYYI